MFAYLKRPLLIGVLSLCISAALLFVIKNEVRNLSLQLKEVNSKIVQEKENIHVLQAEYNYLSNPKRIKKIVDKHLALQTVKTEQILDFKQIEKYLKVKEIQKVEEVAE